MTCTCTPCHYCYGLGMIWYSSDGEYIGRRNDDMGNYEPCEKCNGTGIEDLCEECRQIEELEDEK